MDAELLFAPEAAQDVAEAYSWYEARCLTLGEEYLRCVEACLASLCHVPDGHPAVHSVFRRALVRRFPYAVFYEHRGEQVIVYAVFHTARDPGKWRVRLEGGITGGR